MNKITVVGVISLVMVNWGGSYFQSLYRKLKQLTKTLLNTIEFLKSGLKK